MLLKGGQAVTIVGRGAKFGRCLRHPVGPVLAEGQGVEQIGRRADLLVDLRPNSPELRLACGEGGALGVNLRTQVPRQAVERVGGDDQDGNRQNDGGKSELITRHRLPRPSVAARQRVRRVRLLASVPDKTVTSWGRIPVYSVYGKGLAFLFADGEQTLAGRFLELPIIEAGVLGADLAAEAIGPKSCRRTGMCRRCSVVRPFGRGLLRTARDLPVSACAGQNGDRLRPRHRPPRERDTRRSRYGPLASNHLRVLAS